MASTGSCRAIHRHSGPDGCRPYEDQRFVFRHVADALPDAWPLGSDVMTQNMALSGGHLDEAEEGLGSVDLPAPLAPSSPVAPASFADRGRSTPRVPRRLWSTLRVHDGCTRFDHGRRLAWRAFQPDPDMNSRRGLQATSDAHGDAPASPWLPSSCIEPRHGRQGHLWVEQAGDARTQVL